MKVHQKSNYYAIIDNVDFDHLTDEEWHEIGKLHMKNLVTVIRNCNVDPTQVVDWVSKWGSLRYSSMLNISKNYPGMPAKDIIGKALRDDPSIDPEHIEAIKQRFKTRGPAGTQRVTNIRDKKGDYTGVFPDGEIKWHSNESGNPIFAPGVALLGSENMIGSSTGFVESATYYESISESFRSELNDMVCIHRHKPGMLHVKDLGAQEGGIRYAFTPEDESYVPMVIQSPGGISGLHYSLHTVDGIVGMTKEESDKLFERLNNELMTEKYIWDHWYEHNNDWLFFDNSITQHRRLGDVPGRLAYRVQHDYEHIQIPDYNPYIYHEEYYKIYNDRLNELNSFIKEEFGAGAA